MCNIVQANNSYDPFPEYLYLGGDLSDGLFAWIQIAVNMTLHMTTDSYYAVAAYLEADGGHVMASNSMGGGGDMGGGNGTAPNGTAPPAMSSAV